MKSFYSNIVVTSLFAIAMGLLEAVVVVYLREIYYPEGFDFPLVMIEPRIYSIELVREVTTLIMLITVGWLIGKTGSGKFAGFLYTFGVWDIFYYIGLKAFLNWPASLLTWDILFLIPVTWIGPVLAPVICSSIMIVIGWITLRTEAIGKTPVFGKKVWIVLITGAVLIFISFIQDYTLLLYESGMLSDSSGEKEALLNQIVGSYVPESFNWFLFGIGAGLSTVATAMIARKNAF